ncbi:MAG: sigma-70 family RNA polymerase sigma factor [Cyclobacteriaceae bacterium]|nr:sigma-70 family RNA polymerase sigma factor [Cyclobacteriaceae bacterium HetDA_MAG_MS6]
MRKCLQGNRKYQAILYDRFSAMVMAICSRYSGSAEQAEDVFQEAFLKIFQNLDKVKEAEALPGWIKRIAINTAIDYLKLDKASWISESTQPDGDDQYYAQMVDKISTEEIIAIINELPEGYRLVFNLHTVDGYSHKEISERLDIAESTSRSQLTYAKRLLQEKLKKIGITRYESVI